MDSGVFHARDCPEQCRAVIDVVTAEETTLVDAVSTGRLDRSDLDTFLSYAAAADQDLDPGLIRLLELVTTLLADRNR